MNAWGRRCHWASLGRIIAILEHATIRFCGKVWAPDRNILEVIVRKRMRTRVPDKEFQMYDRGRRVPAYIPTKEPRNGAKFKAIPVPTSTTRRKSNGRRYGPKLPVARWEPTMLEGGCLMSAFEPTGISA